MTNSTPRVKICCISSLQEAQLAASYGADALGLVGQMPSGPGVISDLTIYDIARRVPPPIATFLLTSATKAQAVIEHYKKVQTTTIQLVDALEEQDYKSIRLAFPAVKMVQVIHVTSEESIEEALLVQHQVDAILLDSGNPNLTVKELGGTGKTHNWEWSKAIREQINIPLFLAGGLNAGNIQEAIQTVQPFGVDVCSGVRTNGQLDEQKLKAFFAAISSL